MSDKPKIVSLVPPKDGLVKTVLMAALEQELSTVMVVGWLKNADKNFYLGISTDDAAEVTLLLRTLGIAVDRWIQSE